MADDGLSFDDEGRFTGSGGGVVRDDLMSSFGELLCRTDFAARRAFGCGIRCAGDMTVAWTGLLGLEREDADDEVEECGGSNLTFLLALALDCDKKCEGVIVELVVVALRLLTERGLVAFGDKGDEWMLLLLLCWVSLWEAVAAVECDRYAIAFKRVAFRMARPAMASDTCGGRR